MIKGTTKGFDFEVDEALADDFELLELLADFSENYIMAGKLADKMLGTEQKKALLEALRGEDGRIHTSDVFEALTEIINAFPNSKN